MKVEFELTVDNNGRPIITFSHKYLDNSLDQKVLKVFIDAGFSDGIEIKGSKSPCSGEELNDSFYEIFIKPNKN